MSLPNRVEAIHLLPPLDPPPWHLRRLRAVADTAARLAARIEGHGIPAGRPLVEPAALPYRVDEARPPDDPAAAIRRAPA